MNKVYEYIINEYGYDEPVFSNDLREQLDMTDSAIRQSLRRLTEKGELLRVENGIYYVPKKNSILGTPYVNLEKVVLRKYIKPIDCDVIGFTSGINFANQLGLTSQTASINTIVTNRVKRTQHQEIGKKHVILKCSKVQITKKNYKILQVLNLLEDYNRISETSLDGASYAIKEYLSDVMIPSNEFNEYIKKFSKETVLRIMETGLYSEFTQR
ncbi:DUF6088 family protein [Lysinibacillus sp. UGB7]|uniref:DUF6088 family protein n=1 Tax=Lysinibacillus sp. UGB7 TaxID=3411039 RepID=UPI003B7940C9